jgi:hypothetical protein
MEKRNIFLGKIHKNGCHVNDGKYGYFLACDKKNHKICKMDIPENEEFKKMCNILYL